MNTIVFSIIWTIICSLVLIASMNVLKMMNASLHQIYAFVGICFIVWSIIMLTYVFGVSMKFIFMLFAFFAMLLSVLFFLGIYYSPTICESTGSSISQNPLRVLTLIFEYAIITILLLSYHRNIQWEFYDTLLIIVSLVLLRLSYWIEETYQFIWLKTMSDITLLLIIVINAKRFYHILRA